MKGIKKSKYVLLVSCAVAMTAFGGHANAQTANMTATATVLNTMTIATPAQLNFGTIAAVRDTGTGDTATVTVDTAGAGSVATTGGTAVTAIVDGAAVLAGQITIADSAAGATININIDNVVDPLNGGESFVLDQFTTSYNGAASVPQVINTPWTETFDAAFGAGINTLDVGATITTTPDAGGAAYSDGVYAGTYDVTFSY